MKRNLKKPKVNLLILAFRNLSRHQVKSVITITAVAIGIAFYLFADGFLLGVNTESKRNLVNYEMGAGKIFSRAYWEKKDEYPLYESFGDYAPIIKRLEEKGYSAAPRAVFVGSLISPDEELPFVFIGGDPESERKMFLYHKYIEKQPGAHFMQDGVFEIMIGIKGATDLKVSTGDTVNLSTVIDKRESDGTIRHINQAIAFVVAGIINSPDPMINTYTAFIPLSVLQDELGILLEGDITEIVVRKQGAREDELPGWDESSRQITARLGNALPASLLVTGWEENSKDYLAASAGDIVSTFIFLGFFFVIVIMVIANTVLMSVLERTREIGMLRALGMTNGSIIRLFFIETGLIGFFGALAGLVLFLPLNAWMVGTGIDYTQMINDTGVTNLGYRVVGVFKSVWNLPVMFGSIAVATVIAAVTAFFPSRRAVRMQITDAMRMD